MTYYIRAALLGVTVATSLFAQTPAVQSAAPAPATVIAAPASMDTAVELVELKAHGAWLNQTSASDELPRLLKAEIAKARAQKRTVFLEIGATWCGACAEFEEKLHKHEKALTDAFAGAYLIHLDYDDWSLDKYLLNGALVPAIVALDEDGSVVSQFAGAWTDVTKLKQFVRAHRWKISGK